MHLAQILHADKEVHFSCEEMLTGVYQSFTMNHNWLILKLEVFTDIQI